MATSGPTRIGGHQLGAAPRSAAVVQQIDGSVYSTRRAKLIFDNGRGETLYDDPASGYFLVRISRMLGNVPLLAVTPCSDEGLRNWAAANGVLNRVTGGTKAHMTPPRQPLQKRSTSYGKALLAGLNLQ